MRPRPASTDLIPADGYVASAAHPGRPEVLTAWMDGAVVDENDPVATDPELDLFDENNGRPFQPGVRRALPRRPGGAQPRHHRLGRGRTEAGTHCRVLRPAVHGDAHLGRSADGRPDDRADQARSPTSATPGCRPRPTGPPAASRPPARCAIGWACGACGTPRPEPSRTWRAIDCPGAGDQRRAGHRASSRPTRNASTTRSPRTDKTQVSIDTDHYFTTPGAAMSRPIRSRNG